MNCLFSTYLHLSVVQASATMSLYNEDGVSRSSESFALVLRAAHNTNLVLSTGERLPDVEIHLTLSTKWLTAQDLDRDLANDDVGFLVHTEDERGGPFVHGAALLPNATVVATLLSAGAEGRVTLALSPSVISGDRGDTPFVWGKNRPNALHISHLDVSVLQREGAQGGD